MGKGRAFLSGGGSRPNNNGPSACLGPAARSIRRWFNTPQFGRPNGGHGNVLFGTINGQANSPREVQFGLKLLW